MGTVVTSFSLLSVSQFHLTQFGAFKNVLSHLLETFCAVTTKPNNDHFEINQDSRLRSRTGYRQSFRVRIFAGPQCSCFNQESGWQVTKIRFNLSDIHQISCPFNLPAAGGGILSKPIN